MSASALQFHCFAPRPALGLSDTEAAVFNRMRELRGFFVTSGIEPSSLAILLRLNQAEVSSTLSRLESQALVHQVKQGRYVTTKVRHVA